MKVYNEYESTQTCNLEGIQICKYASVEVWKSANMQEYKYRRLKVYKFPSYPESAKKILDIENLSGEHFICSSQEL